MKITVDNHFSKEAKFAKRSQAHGKLLDDISGGRTIEELLIAVIDRLLHPEEPEEYPSLWGLNKDLFSAAREASVTINRAVQLNTPAEKIEKILKEFSDDKEKIKEEGEKKRADKAQAEEDAKNK